MGKVKNNETKSTTSLVPQLKVDWRELRRQKQKWKKEKEDKKALKQVKEEEKKKVEEDNKKKEESEGIHYTISVAVPGSILNNAQSPELRSYLIGQIARACVIFNCDEIVIYDEYAIPESLNDEALRRDNRRRCLAQMAKVLQYLECPQYLRKHLFPLHEDLQYAGLLNPLDTGHHLKESDESRFREGIVTNSVHPDKGGCYINVGLKKDVFIKESLTPGLRVTIELDTDQSSKKLKGKPIPPSGPKDRAGLYWGYSVRLASSLSDVIAECPYDGGYDLTIGTSERGDNVDEKIDSLPDNFKHCLIVFGGLKGIEAAIDADTKYSNIGDPRDIFQFYLNTCPNQGSNTIRTEEAILVSLAALRPKLMKPNKKSLT
ncbi:putative methyltransferase C9orf114 [Tetranychus urticae]|uniref:Uncharacterized protein n=1 Tax=Tetranychus urticae TaxID=32264 RepID=T1KEU8_TETUR|nr:putative methyltransferase C9orf114 [Tetranychus urticae]